jgi:hypothetical protein
MEKPSLDNKIRRLPAKVVLSLSPGEIGKMELPLSPTEIGKMEPGDRTDFPRSSSYKLFMEAAPFVVCALSICNRCRIGDFGAQACVYLAC